MKVIVISDTHIKYGSIMDYLPGELIRLLKEADMIIHAGDFVTKQAYDELSAISRLEAVHGNMDDVELKELLPERKVIEVEDIKIGVIHEAALSLQDTTGARYMAKEMGVNALVFGHIHKPIIETSDVIIACPGSPTSARLSEPSAIELIIQDGEIAGRVIKLEGTLCGALETARSFQK